MRTFYTKSLLLGLFLLLLASWLELHAQTANITAGCAPLSVAFTAPAGVSNPFWDFQNGGNSSTLNPSAIFTMPGIYEVSLREGQGGALIGTVAITVFTPPELNFTVDTNRGCAPLVLNFANNLNIDPGIGVTSYSWVFGDGGAAQGPNPTHAYATPGLYDISLNLVTNQEGCDQTAVFPGAITVGGVQNLNFFTNPNPAVACEPPLSVAFANITPQVPGLTFSWDMGNGSTFNGAAPPAEIYTNSGNFEVILTGMDSLGCTASRNRFVTVYDGNVPLNAPDTVCLNEYVYYGNFVTADAVSWTFPDNVIETTYDDVPVIVFTEPGWQTVTVLTQTNTPIFCQQDSTFQIYVDDVDESLTAAPTFTCENELTVDFTASSTTGATFTWRYYDMGIDAGAQTTHTYTYVDTLEYAINGLVQYYTTLFATNPSGCRDTLIRADTIFTPNALFMPDVSSGCAPLTVTFYDLSFSFEPLISYVYDYGDGTSATFTNDNTNSHTYTQPGVYEVVLSIENEAGCRDTSYVRRIEVGAPLDIDFTYDDAVVCVDDTIQFTIVNPLPEVDWYEFVEPDTLYYYYNGCLSQTVNPDIIIEGPDVELSYEIDCASPYEVHFTSRTYDATNVVWDFGDGTTSNAPNPVHEYSVTGDFWVYVTAFNPATSCPSRTDSTLICIRDLQVDFEMPAGACLGESVDLDASGTVDVNGEFCAYGFTWMFEQNGRPIMGNDTILPFTFTTPGQDRVTLIAKDVNGCRDTIFRLINVYSITPDFMANDTFICMPGTVNFTDLTLSDTTLVSWNWDFGDNTASTTPMSATHTYNNLPADSSIFVVMMVEDAQGCSITDTLIINTYTPISQIISDVTPLNICEGETINLSATQFTGGGSSLTFEWDLGVGGAPVAGISVSNTYPTAGSYPLTLYYEEIATGCAGQKQATVNVQAYPEAGFTSSVDEAEVVCAPAQIGFTNTSTAAGGLNYQWNFGNGSFSSAPNPVTTFNRGEFMVTLVATTSYGCTDTLQQSYEIVGPAGNFTFGPQAICEGETVTFTLVDTMDVTSFSWDLGDGTVISDVNPLVYTYENVPVLGNRPVTLTLLGANDACELSVTKNLLIRNVQAGFSLGVPGDSLFCAGTYMLSNESVGANSYSWVLPDGSTVNTFEPEFTVEPGTYTISLTVEDTDLGCVNELSQTFTFTQPSFAQAIGDTICPGDTARLSLPNLPFNADVLWAPVTGFLSPASAANPLVLPTQSTTYSATVTDSVGCVSNSMATINIIEPYLWQDIDETACPGDSLLIELPAPDSFFIVTWVPATPPTVIGDEDIDLELMIQDVNGCYDDTYRFFVQSVSDSIVVPNIFSPNGDGINDVFRIFTEIDLERTDMINIKSFRVYNRWGQEVYRGNGPLARWDGTNNGKPAPSEVYIYHIVVDVLKAGREEEFKGQVTLVR